MFIGLSKYNKKENSVHILNGSYNKSHLPRSTNHNFDCIPPEVRVWEGDTQVEVVRRCYFHVDPPGQVVAHLAV